MTSSSHRRGRRSVWQVARDLSLEAASVALFFAGLIFVMAHWNLDPTALRWPAMVTATAIVFGYPVRWHWRSRRRPRFWVAWTVLLVAHLVAYIEILGWDVNFGVFWFAILTPFEWAAINPVLDAVVKMRRASD